MVYVRLNLTRVYQTSMYFHFSGNLAKKPEGTFFFVVYNLNLVPQNQLIEIRVCIICKENGSPWIWKSCSREVIAALIPETPKAMAINAVTVLPNFWTQGELPPAKWHGPKYRVEPSCRPTCAALGWTQHMAVDPGCNPRPQMDWASTLNQSAGHTNMWIWQQAWLPSCCSSDTYWR